MISSRPQRASSSNSGKLYARDELFEQVEQLVGLGFIENRAIRSGIHVNPPVLAVAGSKGMGKSRALKRMEHAYGDRAPRVLLDLADTKYAQQKSGLARGDDPLLVILKDMKWELELRVRLNHVRLSFPRLSAALLAIAIWPADGSELTNAQAVARLKDARGRVAQIAHNNRDSWINGWIKDVTLELSKAAVPFPANVFVNASIHAFTERTLNAPSRRTSIIWHEEFDPHLPGDGYEALNSMSRDFHSGGSYRERAEKRLIAAFLADLGAEYKGLSRLRRTARPVVLIDNVCRCPSGPRFLELVLANRASARADPLVIVAAGPDNPEAWRIARDLDEGDGADPDDQSMADLLLQPGLREVKLTRLTHSHVFQMLDGTDPMGLPMGLDHIIGRLTGGLPLGADVIAAAAMRTAGSARPASSRPSLQAQELLDLPAPGTGRDPATSVTSYVLRRLIPDERWRFRFTTFSPARDLAAAQELGTRYLGSDRDQLAAPEAEAELRANGWGARQQYFVGDKFIRALLLHELHGREDSPTYAEVHSALRDYYGSIGTGPLGESEADLLLNCLALGDTGQVTRRLYGAFAKTPVARWLDAVLRASCAPYFTRPDRRKDVALGGADQDIEDEVHRSVNRLLHGAWFLSDPLVAPDDDVLNGVRGELAFLAKKLPKENAAGSPVLVKASTIWPEEFRSWRQPRRQPPGESEETNV